MQLLRLASPASRSAGFASRRAAKPRSTIKICAPAQEKRAHVVVSYAEKGGRSDGGDDDEKKKPDDEADDAADDDDDDDTPPSLPAGAWRNFRASLVASAAAAAGEKPGPSGDIWSARWTPENVHLFQEQDRELAREPLWVHALEGGLPEPGGLIVATPEAVALTGDERRAQLVCYVTRHCPQRGSVALILNRPATAALGDLLGWGLRFDEGNNSENGDDDDDDGPSTSTSAAVQAAFGDAPVYLGGFFSPARISAQPLTLLHGIPGLPGAEEVVPGGGVFSGGVAAAAAAVVSGEQPASRCRLHAGALAWPPGGLAAEVEAGVWFAAASSRAVVLKPCLGLPVPLWRECLGLMGGEYARAARRRG